MSDDDTNGSGSRTTNPEYEDDEYDSGIASISETTIQRDSETGEVLPRREYVTELSGEVVAKPLVGDAYDRFLGNVRDPDHSKEELSDAELAECFDRHIIKPDLTEHALCGDQVTEKFISEGLTGSMEDGYYIAILLATDEHEMVRRMRRMERGEMTDAEVKMALEEQDRREEEDDGFRPQGDRTERETRRSRAENRGG